MYINNLKIVLIQPTFNHSPNFITLTTRLELSQQGVFELIFNSVIIYLGPILGQYLFLNGALYIYHM